MSGHWRAAVAIYVAGVAILGIVRLSSKQHAEADDRRLMHLAGDLAAYCSKTARSGELPVNDAL
jgi:hypothetical protein